ncbi:acyl-CoA N-acyltransferase [Cercophora newfieldiana]|uniref:Acyl-CoA N-acyltransferase n=1 Tax=Cercophora newfieldiana TaxID=92897 RepID=A0AA40CT13_9PEZI|nr:acyl-CoA N-acyltransferase [Cercophora newfieldiana]
MSIRRAQPWDLEAMARIAVRAYGPLPSISFLLHTNKDHAPDFIERFFLRNYQMDLGSTAPTKLFMVLTIDAPVHDTPKQVVGFAVWRLRPDQSPRRHPIEVEVLGSEGSCFDPHRSQLTQLKMAEATSRHINNHMELVELAVDPDHRRRGHASLLCKHRMDIAVEDKVPIGVLATDDGPDLYQSLGFDVKEKFIIADQRPGMEEELEFWAFEWDPAGKEQA